MRLWIASIGEPIPLGAGKNDRLHRMGAFAHFAASRGHQVTWWASSFEHYRKEHLVESDTAMQLQDGLELRMLRGFGYSRNVSLRRIADHIRIARKFARQAAKLPKPDLIVASLPTVELAAECAEYAKRHDIPVVLDMRDMWPDILVHAMPKAASGVIRLCTLPMRRQGSVACARATAIMGVTEAFVDWGLERGGRRRSRWDRAFPQAYSVEPAPPAELAQAEQFWDSLGVRRDQFNVAFIGNLAKQLHITPALEAARILAERHIPVKFVFCGVGEKLNEYREIAKGMDNVLFPGWADKARIQTLMARSKIGLDPLPNRFDFLASINNKAVEYLSAGLPVLSSPDSGVVYELLKSRQCGRSYPYGDGAECARQIESLVGEPEALEQMSKNARAAFAQEFESGRVFGAMLSHFEDLVEARAKGQLAG